MRARASYAGTATVALAALADPPAASAHAFGGGVEDLPIPFIAVVWGAGIALVASFAALSVRWHRTRFEDEAWHPAPPALSRLVLNRPLGIACGLLGAFLLGVTVWAGLRGTPAPDRNFALTFVFITVLLGFVAVSVVAGDVFRAFNPWRAIARGFAAGFRLIAGQGQPAPLRYPERLGRWPAVAGLLAIGWMELVWGSSGFQAVGLVPHDVAIAVLVYTAWTLAAMALFGIETWLQRGETLSVYFGMFARLAPVEVRDGRLGWRRPLAGAVGWAAVPGSASLVLAAIGITAFDGAQEGLLTGAIDSVQTALADAGLGDVFAHRVTETLFFALTVGAVAGVYWLGVAGMRTVGGRLGTLELGRAFAHSFIPIALAYLVAHYFSFFIYGQEAQFTYLLSDPLGNGSNYFGTGSTSSGIDYSVLDPQLISIVQVVALVAGHITALVLAHDRAVAVYGDSRRATRSQYWMLSLMVGFTTFGLVLLSAANQ